MGGPHRVTDHQAAFLLLTDIEALFGGAAGGGKSESLLMAALQYVDVPDYAALIIRLTYQDLMLPGAIMDRAKDWFRPHPDVRWSEDRKTFTFPSGATLTFGHLSDQEARYRYQSSEFQSIGCDELTQLRESDYRYLFSRLRRPEGMPVPLRMRSGTNPGGHGHEWVKQRFLIEGPGRGRIFVPARLDDNPYLDRVAYERSLAQLDPITRAQLRWGDWGARPPGEMFQREWFAERIVDERPADATWVRRWDLAATEKRRPGDDPDHTAGVLMGRTRDKDIYIADVVRKQGTPGDVEKLVRTTAEMDGRDVHVRMEQEPGSSGKTVIASYAKTLMGFDFRGIPSTGSKAARATPLASFAQAGHVYLVRGTWMSDFLSELEAFPQDAVHDDQVDAASGAFADLAVTYEPGSGEVAPQSRLANPYHADRRSILGHRR